MRNRITSAFRSRKTHWTRVAYNTSRQSCFSSRFLSTSVTPPRLSESPQSPAAHNKEYPINLRFIPPRDILVDVYIGTPPQKFSVILDTGSTDVWVRSETLTPWEPGPKFLTLQSSTWHQSRSHWRIKYLDSTIVEGVEGIEKIRIGDWEFDARIGAAEKITFLDQGKRVEKGKIVGITAGHQGYPAVDGIMGMGLASSIIRGLRNAGIRGIKMTFRADGEGNNSMDLLTNTDAEKGVVWYNVQTNPSEPVWEIVLNKIRFGNQSVPVFRQKILVDTGSVHHYLPSIISEILFLNEPLDRDYMQIHFLATHESPITKADAGWQLLSPTAPETPVHFGFAGSNTEWPLDLKSPVNDEYASIMSAGEGHPAVLGMPFISHYGVIFDFTKGKERIGFIRSEETVNEDNSMGSRPRDRLLQFLVGSSLGLGIAAGWKWYQGSSF